ncbi:MAG: hypothetical protein ACTSQA_00525 [Candidatus Heimdallarchaeaceae archaeon]
MALNAVILEPEVKKALQLVVMNPDKKVSNYAVSYAILGEQMSGYELYVQCLYILSNIQYWRHKEAKKVRKVLYKYKKTWEKKYVS